MTDQPLAAIILAAGQGTRMKSKKHKVLHEIAGKPMLHHLMDAVDALKPEKKVVIVGSGKEQLEAALEGSGSDLALQEPQLGTGHAVQMAEAALAGFEGDALILYGDVPFVPTDTMQAMIDRLNADDAPAVVVLAFEPEDTQAYGRVITDGDRVTKMVEHKDASDAERACRTCNSGLMAAKSSDLFALLNRVDNDNAAEEYYLVDIVNIANKDGRHCAVVLTDPFDVAGINSRAELAHMESEWQQRRRDQAMTDGVTLIAPETVWFSHDTQVSSDVVIEPNVYFGPGVSVESGATIKGHSHIEGAKIGADTSVGPFARLRPGAVLEEGSKIGNFVEMKKAVLGKGAKASHLTYLGDAEVGEGANIGAGTITCNYDGYFKYQTKVGKDAFIGSNSALVAPVTIGDGAIVGAGATVTRDVAAGDLALVRAEQTAKKGWADRFNKVSAKKKAAKSK